jgi:hypothetical protein
MRPLPLILLTAFQAVLAQTPAAGPLSPQAPAGGAAATAAIPHYQIISRKVDALLRRENGTRLEIDELPPNTVRIAKPMNRVYWNSSTKDQRLVSIVIQPLGPEEESTTILTAALLVTVSAVENLDEGIRMATAVKEAQGTDGKPRMVQLGNGVRLFRVREDKEAPKFQINL